MNSMSGGELLKKMGCHVTGYVINEMAASCFVN
jgi:hypothetical protein